MSGYCLLFVLKILLNRSVCQVLGCTVGIALAGYFILSSVRLAVQQEQHVINDFVVNFFFNVAPF